MEDLRSEMIANTINSKSKALDVFQAQAKVVRANMAMDLE